MKTQLAPIPPPQNKSVLIKTFHNEVVTALKEFSRDGQVRMQPIVSDAIQVGSLLSWHQYLSCLNASGVSTERLGVLCRSYALLGGTSPLFSGPSEQGRHARPHLPYPETAPPPPAVRRRPPPPMPGTMGAGLPRRPAPNGPPRHRPTYSTADWELDAAAAGVLAFMKVLRLVQSHSGLNANQLAKITKIPVSSTYRMFDEATKTLPRKPQHITALLYACGLPTAQIDRVMVIWRGLRFDQQALKAATSAPAAVNVPPVENAAPTDLEEPRERAPERPKPPPRPTRPARPAQPTTAQVAGARELLRTRAAADEKPVYLTKRRGAVTRHARRARRARRALMLKVLMSSMVSAMLVAGVLPIPMDSARSMDHPQYDLGVTDLPRRVPSLVPTTSTTVPTPPAMTPTLVKRPGRPQAYY